LASILGLNGPTISDILAKQGSKNVSLSETIKL